MKLDDTDRRLLELIQQQIPLSTRPYLEIAAALGVDEAEVLNRLARLREAKIIRRMGGFFDSRKLGYTGTLCAVQVPAERVDEVAAVVNSYPEVSHNYLRGHEYNIWFTVLAPSTEAVREIIDEIKARAGIRHVLSLPAERVFKIKVRFKVPEVQHVE